MSEVSRISSDTNRNLLQLTTRIRDDQRKRLEIEHQARGINLSEVIRDNLDLAFAVKNELSKIVEGEYDENDPRNAPRLIHSLLFRVEERILSALDGLAKTFETTLNRFAINGTSKTGEGASLETNDRNEVSYIVDEFISRIANNSDHPAEIWVGAFLEIVPRIELVSMGQLTDLHEKGGVWLERQGYYVGNATNTRT